MRTFTPEIEQMIEEGRVRTTNLITMLLNGVTLRLTSYAVDVTMSGNTYQANAALLDLPTLSENSGEPLTSGSIVLSNIGGQFNSTFRGSNQVFTPVQVYVVMVDEGGTVIGVLQTRKLYITSVTQSESETSDSYTIGLSNYLVDFESVVGRTTSEDSQRRYAAQFGITDTGFRHTMVLKSNIPWGK